MRTDPGPNDKKPIKIYTGSGDHGETSLLEGIRVAKHTLRVEVNGCIDELNSWIGYVRALDKEKIVEDKLAHLQHRLNILCSDIAAPLRQGNLSSMPRVLPEWVRELEDAIDQMGKDLLTVSHPILPGGSPIGASLHLARTVCRRAELLLVHLQSEDGNLNPDAIRFLNRLSDFLFMLARWANYRAGIVDDPDINE